MLHIIKKKFTVSVGKFRYKGDIGLSQCVVQKTSEKFQLVYSMEKLGMLQPKQWLKIAPIDFGYNGE